VNGANAPPAANARMLYLEFPTGVFETGTLVVAYNGNDLTVGSDATVTNTAELGTTFITQIAIKMYSATLNKRICNNDALALGSDDCIIG
jgi:hypothetical protein